MDDSYQGAISLVRTIALLAVAAIQSKWLRPARHDSILAIAH